MIETLPLLHEGDAFTLSLEVLSPRVIRLCKIIRYAHNENVEGVLISFYDLDPETKRAIIKQINRRYVGRTIKV